METEKYLRLLKSCRSKEEFKKLWNPDKFDWFFNSYLLCEFCSDYFHIWWNSEKYPYSRYSYVLCEHCSRYFHIWWNFEKFNWYVADALNIYCQDYKHIWGKDYIKWKISNT